LTQFVLSRLHLFAVLFRHYHRRCRQHFTFLLLGYCNPPIRLQ
uniref:Ovule protein n=1 Tax=Brugia timori TaxID=42155 RepID=A0A0R3Q644_9BILA